MSKPINEEARMIKSRAVVCRTPGGPITVEDLFINPPGRNEVTVRLKAVGVCQSDSSTAKGKIVYRMPIVLGHEGAGVIEAVGEGVQGFAVGDHVLSSFVAMCGHCKFCDAGRPQLCDQPVRAALAAQTIEPRYRDASGEGLNVMGGCGVMAERATLSVDNIVKIDPTMPMEPACLVSCGVMTGVGAAINTAQVKPGSSVMVVGCGGVGLSAVQGARIAGATMIIAVDPLDYKLKMARDFGATHTVSAADPDWVQTVVKMTGGGVEYAIECVGVGSVTAQMFTALAKGGVGVSVGIPSPTDTVPLPARMVTSAERTLRGSFFGSARPKQDFPRLISLYRAGQLKIDELITHRYTLDQAPQAFADLEAGKNARGIIVFD
jgi:NDMA-dependent alcohol dehydrogenase